MVAWLSVVGSRYRRVLCSVAVHGCRVVVHVLLQRLVSRSGGMQPQGHACSTLLTFDTLQLVLSLFRPPLKSATGKCSLL